MDLSIIIVPYKAKDKLEVTLDAVFASKTNYSYEVIVLDNLSEDGTDELMRTKYAQHSNLTYIQNGANLGFPIANNKGMRLAKGDYILLLNPDTKVAEDNFQVMMDFIKSCPDVGIATSKLIKANGELDWACRRTEPDPKIAIYRLSGLQKLFPKKFGSYNVLNKSVDEESQIDACTGAYMLFSRKIYELTKGFDEQFFMYGEDLDLCKRVRDLGYKIWYYPKTYSYHYKGQSSRKAPKLALYAFHKVMILYYKKHYQKKYHSIFMDAFVYTGVWGRYWLKRLQNLFRKEAIVSKS